MSHHKEKTWATECWSPFKTHPNLDSWLLRGKHSSVLGANEKESRQLTENITQLHHLLLEIPPSLIQAESWNWASLGNSTE